MQPLRNHQNFFDVFRAHFPRAEGIHKGDAPCFSSFLGGGGIPPPPRGIAAPAGETIRRAVPHLKGGIRPTHHIRVVSVLFANVRPARLT